MYGGIYRLLCLLTSFTSSGIPMENRVFIPIGLDKFIINVSFS